MVTCPVCGLAMKNVARTHLAKHGLTRADFHALRIEHELGNDLRSFLHRVYVEERLSSTQIHRQYGITYRVLRELLGRVGIPMRSMSDAIAASWEKDDGSRSVTTAETMRATNERHDLPARNNPAKRPDIRRKIAAAKRRSNPGLLPMLEALAERRLTNPSELELAMQGALDAAGLSYEREYRVGHYFIDFALPSSKIAIECDGSGWHAAKPGHDAQRDAWLSARGWRVFRFDQTEIRAGADACVSDVLAKLDCLGVDPTTSG